MKRWLKMYGRRIMTGLGVLFIANGVYGMFNATSEWEIFLHISVIIIWLIVIVVFSGAFKKYTTGGRKTKQ